jgi:hypothetical protein
MRLLLVLVLVAGCSDDLLSRSVVITAFKGDRPAPGVSVISHAGDRVGSVIELATTDVLGQATISVNDDALVSVVFPSPVQILTVPAPRDQLSVNFVAELMPEPAVAVLNVTGLALPGAESFSIDVGCARVSVPSLPATIDLEACALGSDEEIDVVVTGHHWIGDLSNAEDGYAARRVPIVNGIASLDISAWETTMADLPLTSEGFASSVNLTFLSDGLPFGGHRVGDQPLQVRKGLVIDSTRVVAVLVGNRGTRSIARTVDGIPETLSFSDTDYLPLVEPTATPSSFDPLALRWDAAAIGDAVDLRLSWNSSELEPRAVSWRAVLPPDATSVTLPAFVGDLAAATSRAQPKPDSITLSYVDSPSHDGFAAFLADGVDVTYDASAVSRVTSAVGWR